MNRRKALSLLLAASMVFTMNTVAFAEETTAVDEAATVAEAGETVDEELVYKDMKEHDKVFADVKAQVEKANAETLKTIAGSFSGNSKTTTEAYAGGVSVSDEVYATGKKIKADAIGFFAAVSANGYLVPVKAVKITSNAKKPGEIIKWKFSKIAGAKNVIKADGSVVTLSEGKKAYKDLKTAFNSAKNAEFQSVIMPRPLYNVVSADYVKALIKGSDKKQVSYNARYHGLDGKTEVTVNDHTLVATIKNGAVKKVQLVTLEKVKSTGWDIGDSDPDTGAKVKYNKHNGFKKIKLTTLKKDKDYTLSGNFVLVDPSSVYYYTADGVKAFEAK